MTWEQSLAFLESDHDGLLPNWICRPCGNPDVEMNSSGSDAGDEHEVERIEPQRRRREGKQSSLPNVFWPKCFNIAGQQHIIDNLTEDVHLSLSYWDRFFSQLKCCEAICRVEERRQRFVMRCLRGSTRARRELKVENCKGSLYDKRWREVVHFIKEFNKVKVVYALAWCRQNT